MIKMDISTALFFYLFGTVIMVFILWFWMTTRKSAFNMFKADEKDIWQCSVCHYIYIDSKSTEFSRCPQCKSITEKGVQGL